MCGSEGIYPLVPVVPAGNSERASDASPAIRWSARFALTHVPPGGPQRAARRAPGCTTTHPGSCGRARPATSRRALHPEQFFRSLRPHASGDRLPPATPRDRDRRLHERTAAAPGTTRPSDVRAPAGIELLSDSTWDCACSGGSWSPSECECGCGSGEECGCGGNCGGRASGADAGDRAPRFADYEGDLWASMPGVVRVPQGGGGGAGGGEVDPLPAPDPKSPLLRDYEGEIWASSQRAVTDTNASFGDTAPEGHMYDGVALWPWPTGYTTTTLPDNPGCDWIPGVTETPCTTACCAVHDACYHKHHCSALSWINPWASWECKACNYFANVCFAACDDQPGPCGKKHTCYTRACGGRFYCDSTCKVSPPRGQPPMGVSCPKGETWSWVACACVSWVEEFFKVRSPGMHPG